MDSDKWMSTSNPGLKILCADYSVIGSGKGAKSTSSSPKKRSLSLSPVREESPLKKGRKGLVLEEEEVEEEEEGLLLQGKDFEEHEQGGRGVGAETKEIELEDSDEEPLVMPKEPKKSPLAKAKKATSPSPNNKSKKPKTPTPKKADPMIVDSDDEAMVVLEDDDRNDDGEETTMGDAASESEEEEWDEEGQGEGQGGESTAIDLSKEDSPRRSPKRGTLIVLD